MLSQYSWGDFFKFILALAIPYYAFVIIKYYREDIREWISNRGKAEPKQIQEEEQEEEDTPRSIFTVNDYSDPEDITPASRPSSPIEQVDSVPMATDEISQSEIHIDAPLITKQSEDVFWLPVAVPVENMAELSVDDIIAAASRIEPNENGVLLPVEADDEPAAKLAAVINNQQGRTAFSDFSFTR